ncbi:hypothetical protein DIPPA_17088 [Diplonema papillatum]|nr:hypothetical protein DIPPA_17088 [Diplonema papillatum]
MIKEEEKLNRELCKPGAQVFYWEPNHAWSLGRVVSDNGKVFKVSGVGYCASKKADLETVSNLKEDKIWPAREDVLEEDVDDLLNLTELHDATLQRCLYIRYMRDVVYTNIGAIVVAVNPWNFKIPWYTDDNMPRYLAEGEVVKDCLPHSWSQAHNTWMDMRRDTDNQTILISGESGAGKTEAAKIVMKYLGCLSCMQGVEADRENARKVAFNINQASPVLEGFGNAKTVRNDNSSRFGKFMKVQFNSVGNLVGAFTVKYLLEKSRIISANPNERVYHAFYLLCKGRDAGKYGVTDPTKTHCNSGNCVDIPGVDDNEDYSLCITAMDNCGFSPADIDGVWSVVAGVVHALQVGFETLDEDSCKVSDASADTLGKATGIWKVDKEKLMKELTTTTFETRDGPVVSKLTTVKATDARDGVCKLLYDEVFGWEVEKINQNTDSGKGENFIGLLDIFGFEDFELNSFEQICINLANETLQNHYNAFIFTKDMDECRSEGIDVTEVKCPDNTLCLKLMCDKIGIFGLLDDECTMGKGSDAGFIDKVMQNCKQNPFFAAKKLSKECFIVHHYAASVTYTVKGWLDKNRDTVKPDMKRLMRASELPFVAGLIALPDENAKKITVGGVFRESLTSLMALINSTAPHWIRCVKPHPAKKPLMVDGITTMSQLESSGVLGTVKIRKAGFPVRPTFQKFIARFKVTVPGPHPPLSSDIKVLAEFCKKIVAAGGMDKKKAQVGKSRVFLKNESSQGLEALRERALQKHLKVIKQCGYTVVSSFIVRRVRLVTSAKLVQKEFRDWTVRTGIERAEIKRIKKELAAAMAAEQKLLTDEHDAGTSAIQKDEESGFAAIRKQIGDVTKHLRVKAEKDAEVRSTLVVEAAQEKLDIFHEHLPAFDEFRYELVTLLLDSLEAAETDARSEFDPKRALEWERITVLFEAELSTVELTTMYRREKLLRTVLVRFESLHRQEMHERVSMLPEFLSSLDEHALPWLESLGAVRFWSDHFLKRKRRIQDTRIHLREVRLYEEQQSATAGIPVGVYRDQIERLADLDRVWKGCTGVPDHDQMKKTIDRAPLSRPHRSPVSRPTLDGSSSNPSRDASPWRTRAMSGSPSRTGGGTRLIAKSPILPDHAGHQQSKRVASGAPKLGDIGTYTTQQFMTMRAKMIELFSKLKIAGHYPFDGTYTYESNITSLKTLRKAQDVLHDLRADLCSTLSKQVASKMAFARSHGVMEQNQVTGKWTKISTGDFSAAEFQGDPSNWEGLQEELERLRLAIKSFKDEMVKILKKVTDDGHTTLAECTLETPYSKVKDVFSYWLKAHRKDLKGVSEEEAFTLVSRQCGGGPPIVPIPPNPPSPGPGMKLPKTPRAHIEATSPERARGTPPAKRVAAA